MKKIISCLSTILLLSLVATTSAKDHPQKSPFIKIVEDLKPSVVHIKTRQKIDPRDQRTAEGSGSGFLIDADGTVLTNNHVVANASDIMVVFYGGKSYAAKFLGGDPDIDLAVIKIVDSTTAFRPVTLGDSSRIKIAEDVIAIGSPMGYHFTVTRGIVSAVGRVYENEIPLEFIQTDAAINRGNSGGPLVNDEGLVIGINTATARNAEGISFSIPINYAKDILNDLRSGRKPHKGWIGILTDAPYSEDYALWKLPGVPGAFVTKIVPGSPAEKDGLKRNDYITAVDGRAINGRRELQWLIRNAENSVTLEVYRLGKKLEIKVRVVPDHDPH